MSLTAAQFLEQIAALPRLPDREDAVLAAVQAGQHVAWPLVEVPVPIGQGTLVIRVAADYLAIGVESDFVRVPVGGRTAQRICDLTDSLLPTPRLVDLVWRAADVRLAPQPWGPPYDASMLGVDRFAQHNQRIEKVRGGRAGLVAGHKKDVVISNRLVSQPKQVAIYGWHTPQGVPIQPLSLIHEATYADYSHGIRLISKTAYLDGAPVALAALLGAPEMARYLSAEGPLQLLRYPGVPEPALEAVSQGPLGARALSVAVRESEQPGWESPPGTHRGPRIAAYFAGCTRNGKPLGITEGNWCAAFASYCAAHANDTEGQIPHEYRASVAELWADALRRGAAQAVSSGYRPAPGDLAIFGRAGQDPTKGGLGHVGRVERVVDGAGHYATLDGNHGGAVARVERSLAETLGFIAYPRSEAPYAIPSEEELVGAAEIHGDPPEEHAVEAAPGPRRLPPDKTVVTALQMYEAFCAAWREAFEVEAHRTSVLVLLAQWALETGRGASMRAFNVGNLKSREGDGYDYSYFACNEILHGKVVWFYPDDPGCRFRAYTTLEAGVADYLALLHTRFAKAWPAVLAGSPDAFAHLLKVQGYYTADEAQYTRSVVSLFNEYARSIPLGAASPVAFGLDGARSLDDLESPRALFAALRRLGFDPGPVLDTPGPTALAAVQAFQAASALVPDGALDAATRAAIRRALG